MPDMSKILISEQKFQNWAILFAWNIWMLILFPLGCVSTSELMIIARGWLLAGLKSCSVHQAAGHTVSTCQQNQKKKASAVVSAAQNGLMKNWHCFSVPQRDICEDAASGNFHMHVHMLLHTETIRSSRSPDMAQTSILMRDIGRPYFISLERKSNECLDLRGYLAEPLANWQTQSSLICNSNRTAD